MKHLNPTKFTSTELDEQPVPADKVAPAHWLLNQTAKLSKQQSGVVEHKAPK
jgi:hypothetical protein